MFLRHREQVRTESSVKSYLIWDLIFVPRCKVGFITAAG